MLPAVERIAQKHASFNIQPEQYQIVGHHLLKTLEEMFNPGDEVLDAWGKAYGVLADVFIQRESQIYQQSESTQGGWRDLRPFKILKKRNKAISSPALFWSPKTEAAWLISSRVNT